MPRIGLKYYFFNEECMVCCDFCFSVTLKKSHSIKQMKIVSRQMEVIMMMKVCSLMKTKTLGLIMIVNPSCLLTP